MSYSTSRSIIIDRMSKINNIEKNNLVVKNLSFIYNCKCTDCDGNDSIIPCSIETEYFKKKRVSIKVSTL